MLRSNLESARKKISSLIDAGYNAEEISAHLIENGPLSTNLHLLKDPVIPVERFMAKIRKEKFDAIRSAKVKKVVSNGQHVNAAKLLLGEQEETSEAKLERDLVTERARRVEAERLLRVYNDRASVEDRIANFLQAHVEANPYKPRLAKPNKVKMGGGVADSSIEMMLMVSDAHFPEVVDPAEAMGLSYGPEAARARMEYLVERTTRLVDVQKRSGNVSKLTVAVLGDMLSGNIHEELSETNDTVIVEATTEMGYMLYDMGRLFAAEVPEVEMIIIPGNHPRLHKKPRAKKRYDNFEYLMGQLALAHSSAISNLTVKVPKDIIYVHDIMGYQVGMTHGDGSKANSFAGIPFYGLKQRSNATQAMRSRLGQQRLDMMVMGHYHQLLTWQEGDCQIVINGSIKGGDEYGIVSRSSAPEAVQALLTFHRERGWINLAKIPLDHIK